MDIDFVNKQDKAFSFYFLTLIKQMKERGATDKEINIFMDNVVKGFTDVLLEYGWFSRKFFGIVDLLLQTKNKQDFENHVSQHNLLNDLMKELNNTLSDRMKVLLKYNVDVDFSKEYMAEELEISGQDIVSALLLMIRKNEI